MSNNVEDLDEMLFEDVQQQKQEVPTDEKLRIIAQLAEEQTRLEDEVARLTRDLKLKQAELFQVSSVRLPKAMDNAKVSKFKLTSGFEVSVESKVHSGLTEENRPAGLSWLRETGNDGIIKNDYVATFGKGQGAEANELEALLKEKGFSFSHKEHVHPQTLGAFIRKRLEAGQPTPVDIFSIHEVKTTKITRS